MAGARSFPTRGVLNRPRFSPVDVIVFVVIVLLLFGVLRLAHAMNASTATAQVTVISTRPSELPYYAARSFLRMFIAFFLSIAFTFVYATAAARSRRARLVLIPLLDILQSVPVLGFLAITITFFIALFPGSVLGLECASIFAIFTSQAWNMTFSMYHSLITEPTELDEAARMFRLTKWERFWRLDVPGSMIGLVWNGMMSFGGGWFFLAASEAISVGNTKYTLPGIGSYVQAAVDKGDLAEVGAAIAVMVIMVVGVNVLFWRPLVAYAEKFRVETSEAAEQPKSYVLNFLRQSRVPGYISRPLRPVGRDLDRATRPFGLAESPLRTSGYKRRSGDVAFTVVTGAVILWGIYRAAVYFDHTAGFSPFIRCLGLGFLTFARVAVVVVASTLIWVPVGAKIGMSPRLSRYAQPVVQVLASFPAILLFPFAIVIFLALGISLNFGGILLMALGAQWYILFNVIAGASAIPTDLRELMDQFRVPWRQKWRQLILPGIFPYYVTGGITAAGGAWNASIVAEIATYGTHHLTASGLGAYIAQATVKGDFPGVLAGIVVMSFYVVVVNRLLWRPLYHLAETKYSL
ncbi:MAG: ABC transporter permease subunit [Streptosporangiaceae bacterium]|jgi:NitT/TauT family transport system permease protein